MKTNLFVLILFLIAACGGKNRSNSSSPAISELDSLKEEFSFISIQQSMIQKGIHFTRLSQLQDFKRPIAIYCSNTMTLNHEKVEALATLIESLLISEVIQIHIDKAFIEKEVFIDLIEKASNELQAEPYSNTCPKIYLAIQSV